MFQKIFSTLIAAAICLSFSAGSANAQFKIGGKLGSISKKARSRVSAPAKSFPKPKLSKPAPVKSIGTWRPKLPAPKLPVTLPKPRPITLPKRGIGFPKPPVTLPKPRPITLPKPLLPFPKPGIGIKKPLPIKFPKPGTGPFVPPNPEITPLPEPITYPRPDGCWKPPHRCDWWIDICTPIRICRPVDVVQCHWNVVRCDVVIGGQVVADSRWYLGVEGVFLPGKGLGIESVAAGSPAALAGLTAGMVITEANGVAMQTEEVMQQVIASSQGTLSVILLSEASEQPLQGTIQMVQLASARF